NIGIHGIIFIHHEKTLLYQKLYSTVNFRDHWMNVFDTFGLVSKVGICASKGPPPNTPEMKPKSAGANKSKEIRTNEPNQFCDERSSNIKKSSSTPHLNKITNLQSIILPKLGLGGGSGPVVRPRGIYDHQDNGTADGILENRLPPKPVDF
uniref:Uncharacterized protein n=1 Tax=Romanomermis culicivorax TaxID=13658 RepID=A0A915HI15_ROMCU